MQELIRYDAMCTAIAECHQIDEVKDLRDKAMALELYARQARNTDAERKASEVRLRAERRTGELLKELARMPAAVSGALNGRAKEGPATVAAPSAYRQAIDTAQIPERTAQRYQALANVPSPVFEEALRNPVVKPTTAALIRQARDPQPKMPDDVLWLWGRMRDFERDGYANKDVGQLLSHMTDTMRADVLRIVPLMADFFNQMNEVSHEHA